MTIIEPTSPCLIEFPKIEDPRGNLSFIEGGRRLPFEVERVYWTFDIPSGRERFGRALRTCAEVIIATSGCFDVIIDRDDGHKAQYTLNRSNVGLFLPPMTWRTMENFATGSTCLTVASRTFDESDYIRDIRQFIAETRDNENR